MNKDNSSLLDCERNKRWLTVSNVLTVSRIIAAPLMILLIAWHWWGIAFSLLLFAALTDFVDGYLARLFCEQTVLGTLLDPLADKIFLLAVFSALAFVHSPSFSIPPWFFVLVFVREIILLGGTFFMMCTDKNFIIKPMWWGKLTTFFQILFIVWIFVCYFFTWVPAKTYFILLHLLSLFSVITLLQYVKIGLDCLGKYSFKSIFRRVLYGKIEKK